MVNPSRLYRLLIVVALITLPVVAFAQNAERHVVVGDGGASLMPVASTINAPLRMLPSGTDLILLVAYGDWLQVRVVGSQDIGYVETALVAGSEIGLTNPISTSNRRLLTDNEVLSAIRAGESNRFKEIASGCNAGPGFGEGLSAAIGGGGFRGGGVTLGFAAHGGRTA